MAYLLFIFLFLFAGCNPLPDYTLSKEIPEVSKTREAKLLSAFFGLDNSLPLIAAFVWFKAPRKDGMPLVFSHEINPKTLNPDVFRVTTEKGEIKKVLFASFKPAIEAFELRTILLIGDFGDTPDNQPVEVEIIGDLKSRDEQSFKGQKIKVIPLEEGPFISYAEYFSFDKNYPYKKTGMGCDCPKEETTTVVRTIWAGGVKAVNGRQLGKNELNSFTITLVQNSDTIKVHPFHIADIYDFDNNIDLCVKENGIPIWVEARKNIATDPNGDKNPKTKMLVSGRF